MNRYDVAVIGAGLAGLVAARDLATKGWSVLLVDRKADLGKGVHTTGIFVRKTFEDFDLPAGCLGPALRTVTLYSPAGRAISMESQRAAFRVGDMPRLYRTLLAQAVQAGVDWWPQTRFVGHRFQWRGNLLSLEGKTGTRFVTCRYVIGADGARSKVARALGLHCNEHFLVGAETVYRAEPQDRLTPGLYCTIDPQLAPGYLAWVTVDGVHKHVGTAGLAGRFSPKEALDQFTQRNVTRFKLRDEAMIERRGGLIPVGGIGANLANGHGILIGDATGAVSPLTAGGLDPCLRLTGFACQVVDRYLAEADPGLLHLYHGRHFRPKFAKRLLLRKAMDHLTTSWLCEAAFLLLRLPPFRVLAEDIFFRRASFPDPARSHPRLALRLPSDVI